jgi:hypothetical protein
VVASAYALEGFPPDLASAIPVAADVAPDFAGILERDLSSSRALTLAHRYFSVEAWDSTVGQLLDIAAEGVVE